MVEKYTAFEELTPKMLNEFVDKILVHKAEKIDRQRTQTVEVYLNFIGKIDFPEPEKTEADLEQEKIDKYWKDRYWKHKEYELARRKKEMELLIITVTTDLRGKKEPDSLKMLVFRSLSPEQHSCTRLYPKPKP